MNLMRTFQRIYELLKIEQIHDFYLVSWKIKIIFLKLEIIISYS